MRILIATASRHGATREIGQWLGASILREMSNVDSTTTVDVRDAVDVDSIAEYDAAISAAASTWADGSETHVR